MGTEPEILLAEDDKNYAEMVLMALAKRGWRERAFRVRDGGEALDYLFATGAHSDRGVSPLPKVMLLDLHLPKFDGREVLARLRQEPRTRALPVFMMTGSDDDRDIAECRRLGIEGYIVKPARFTTLIEVLERIGPYLAATGADPLTIASSNCEYDPRGVAGK